MPHFNKSTVLLLISVLSLTGIGAAAASAGIENRATGVPSCCMSLAMSFTFQSGIMGFWDNYGHYMPRIHCLSRADGTPDWPWIITLIILNVSVVVGYAKIFFFWRRSYRAEAPRDRNRKLMDLAYIFLWCGICGYAMSVLMFFWPAYRLSAVALAILIFFTWRFAYNLGDLTVSLSAMRLKRELRESLENRASELERLVDVRTRELESARAAAIAADQAKSAFLANMSHEIRTPMTAILGFTRILDDRTLDAETRQRFVGIVRRNSQHLINVINDILDMARIEAGKLNLELAPCDLRSLIHDVRTLMKQRVEEKPVTLDVEIGATVPRIVRTDSTRLRQILLNIVGNAIKFTDRGSILVRVRQEDSSGQTIIQVRDTGIGMTTEQMSRLFERFTQADQSTSRKYGGSGLGLIISKRLTELLGGTISVESRPGEGSTFTLRIVFDQLPTTANCSDHAKDMTSGSGQLQGVSILVVDDSVDNRQLISHLLGRHGARLEVAGNGREGIQKIEQTARDFDIVLMDIHMPELDGHTATRALREVGYAKPIIALTANNMSGDREKCLQSGCDDYVSKPVDEAHLLAAIQRQLSRPGAMTPTQSLA